MARFGSLGTQYFDNSGQPLSGGTIEFFESGSSTPKTVYSDADQTIAHPLAVPLDAAGRQPDIYFNGTAKSVLKDSDGAQITAADPIGAANSEASFSDWNALLTYSAEDIVQGSNDRYYQAVTNNNVGKDPTLNPLDWQEIRFVAVWVSTYTYKQGQIVTASNGALYRCINGNSLGDDPVSTPAEWAEVGTSGWSSLVEDLTPQLGGNLDTQTFTVDGRDVSVDGTKLDGIESGATADQTDAEIKTAYENNADTNAFTDAEQSKLAGISNSANNYVLPVAESAVLGGVLEGGDINISGTGVVTVKNNSHLHTIANVTDLQTELDGKADAMANWTLVQNGTTLEFRYNGVAVAEITSSGAIVAEGDVTAIGTA